MNSKHAYASHFRAEILAISVILLFSFLIPQRATALNKDDFKINSDFGKVEQNHPRIGLRPGGGFVVVWTDYRFGQADIYLQLFDTAGSPVGQNRRLNTDTVGAVQIDPVVAVASDGSSHTIWTDYRQFGYPFDPDLALQEVSATGTPGGTNRILTTENPDSLKSSPDVAINPVTGEIIVVWEDFRNLHWDIYAQILTSQGVPVGSNVRINDDLANAQQHAPRIDCSPNGWYVIVWYDNRETNDDIFSQVMRADHSRIGSNLKVNSGGLAKRQANPDVACDGTGKFTVAWVDWRDGTYPKNPNIYSRKFDTTLLALNSDVLMNSDQTERAQRDVCIAADPRGNVAIVWSDSTERSWDLTGQMLTVDGQVKEQNFLGHSLRDSAQLRADIALDGRSRYLVWVDSRNGHWDIYCRIVEYNSPKLLLKPAALQFERETGLGLPAAQEVVVDHQGYNPINYRIENIPDWLRVNGVAGTFNGLSIDTLSVSIVDTGLQSGTYPALLRFIDLDNADSSVVLSITYRIGNPIVQLATDSMNFQSVPFLNKTFSAELSIQNIGVGALNWSASSSELWCTVNPITGSSQLATIAVNASILDTGQHLAYVTFTSNNVNPSVDSLRVHFNILDRSFLSISPEQISFVQSTLDTAGFAVHVQNLGSDSIHWTARTTASWLSLDTVSGTDGDSLSVRVISFNIAPGTHTGWVILSDSNALNFSDSTMVTMTVHYPGSDTLFVSDLSVGRNQSGVISLVYRANGSVSGIDFPLLLPTEAIHFDSMSWMIPDWAVIPSFDSATGKLQLLASMAPPIEPGIYEIAHLYVTGFDRDTVTRLTVDQSLGRPLRKIEADGDTVPVSLFGGQIVVQTGTAVGDDETLPYQYGLLQNYPNPFNPTTTISFSLAERSDVRLAVYNLLGQEVALLVDRQMSAGEYSVEFGGSPSGLPLSSGVYFARLDAQRVGSALGNRERFSKGIKLLLLK